MIAIHVSSVGANDLKNLFTFHLNCKFDCTFVFLKYLRISGHFQISMHWNCTWTSLRQRSVFRAKRAVQKNRNNTYYRFHFIYFFTLISPARFFSSVGENYFPLFNRYVFTVMFRLWLAITPYGYLYEIFVYSKFIIHVQICAMAVAAASYLVHEDARTMADGTKIPTPSIIVQFSRVFNSLRWLYTICCCCVCCCSWLQKFQTEDDDDCCVGPISTIGYAGQYTWTTLPIHTPHQRRRIGSLDMPPQSQTNKQYMWSTSL